MNKCIAIPIENGVLCAHFGHCEQFAIVEVENNAIKDIRALTPPEHVPGLYPRWVAQFGVTDVIAGGMGQKAIDLFNQQKINVFAGAPVKNPSELVTDFLAGTLSLQANYCDHDSHQHERGHGCRH
ncbi:MAG: NifB/NifX family molybdenum-iron cluster-binding protein [Bacteroidales bacterium]|jgi:predicted Fe-Mo cluster-binding NifX family protein|nr:NifB/NifX family molybdenum-iron cluster-binding protein [Bacteroidales bacterium]NLM92899.1 ATPase [Bacteroidales bacterium]